MLFDSHCHLTDERFADDVDAVLARAREAGLVGVVSIASDEQDAERALALARAHADVWCSAGIHPHAAERATPAALARVRALAADPNAVAIGETGLDFYYDNAPRKAQLRAFEWHIQLAQETGKPLIVHSREAEAETAAVIAAAGAAARGVLHCFAAGATLLEAGLSAGWHVSFAGLVSFRNYSAQDLVRAVPADRLLLETDSPYLAPVPLRGRRNEPAFVRHVAEAVATIRGEDVAVLAERCTHNARAFYGLED